MKIRLKKRLREFLEFLGGFLGFDEFHVDLYPSFECPPLHWWISTPPLSALPL
jgi:hypothetical protein